MRSPSPAEVVQIRERRAHGESLDTLGRAFFLSSSAISRICLGQTHKAVGGPTFEPNAIAVYDAVPRTFGPPSLTEAQDILSRLSIEELCLLRLRLGEVIRTKQRKGSA